MIEIDNAVRLDQKETLRMVVESAKDFSEQYPSLSNGMGRISTLPCRGPP